MIYLYAFLIGGLFCLIAQLIMDFFHFLPIHLTVMYVVVGSLLEAFGIYDKIIDFCGAGALVQISSFGHSLTHAAVESASKDGLIGLCTGIFNLSASGLSFAVLSAFLVALVFKPRG